MCLPLRIVVNAIKPAGLSRVRLIIVRILQALDVTPVIMKVLDMQRQKQQTILQLHRIVVSATLDLKASLAPPLTIVEFLQIPDATPVILRDLTPQQEKMMLYLLTYPPLWIVVPVMNLVLEHSKVVVGLMIQQPMETVQIVTLQIKHLAILMPQHNVMNVIALVPGLLNTHLIITLGITQPAKYHAMGAMSVIQETSHNLYFRLQLPTFPGVRDPI